MLKNVSTTTREIRVRVAEHRSCIRIVNKEAPLVQQFLECQHPPHSFRFLILELIKTQTGHILNIKECLLQR